MPVHAFPPVFIRWKYVLLIIFILLVAYLWSSYEGLKEIDDGGYPDGETMSVQVIYKHLDGALQKNHMEKKHGGNDFCSILFKTSFEKKNSLRKRSCLENSIKVGGK